MSLRFTIQFLFIAALLCARPLAAQWEYVGAPEGGEVSCIVKVDSVIIVGSSYRRAWRSVDNGNHWEMMTMGPNHVPLTGIQKLAVGSQNEIIATDNYVMSRSRDLGATWSVVDTQAIAYQGLGPICFLHDTLLMAWGSNDNPYGASIRRSLDDGVSWEYMNSGMQEAAYAFAVAGDDAYVACGIIRKWNRSLGEWDSACAGVQGNIVTICTSHDTVYAAGDDGVFCSTDSGRSWKRLFNAGSTVASIAACGSRIVAITADAIVQSRDGGATWTADTTHALITGASCVLAADSVVLAGTTGAGVWQSSMHDVPWHPSNSGMHDTPINAFVSTGKYLLAATGSTLANVRRSDDSGRTWLPFSIGLSHDASISTFYVDDTTVYAAHGVNYRGSLARSNGISWTNCELGTGADIIFGMTRLGNKLFAGAGGLFESDDDGLTWNGTRYGDTYSNGYVYGIGSVGGVLFRISDWSVWRSLDTGKTWARDTVGRLPVSGYIQSGTPRSQLSTVVGDTLFVSGGPSSSSLYMTSDSAITWSRIALPGSGFNVATVSGLLHVGSNVFVSSYLSYEDSSARIAVVLPGDTIAHSIAANLPLGSQGLAIMGGYLYVATQYEVYRRLIAEILSTVGVHEKSTYPTAWSLNQNFPNPFSGVTTIEYTVAQHEHATLHVYDMLGRDVATLAAESQPGVHRARWDASSMPRGTYVCRLTSAREVKAVAMIVIR